MNDIIKGVVYNRGTATLQGEKKYMYAMGIWRTHGNWRKN